MLGVFTQHFHPPKLRPGLAILGAAAAFALASPSAHAIPWYIEFGGGPAIAGKTDPLMSRTASKLEGGFAGEFTLGFHLQERQNGILFQLGIQQRYLGGNTTDGNTQIMPTYGLFRVEIWRLMLGVGYSMHVWKDSSFAKHPGASALLYEATFLFPITPEIDFALQGAAQYLSDGNGNKGPDPSYEALALFRLNFGLSDSARSARRKYKGWRYPFGNPLF